MLTAERYYETNEPSVLLPGTEEYESVSLEIKKLGRDVEKMAGSLRPAEARYIVDMYYTLQAYRIASAAQMRSASKDGEPHMFLVFNGDQFLTLERMMRTQLGAYSQSSITGKWAESQYGIGPVLSAGLLAYIDIVDCLYAGRIWQYAGINPGIVWEKKQKRPWNAKLKTLTWKIGQSFMKLHKNDKCFYGHLYRQKKDYYFKKNQEGDFAQRAAEILAEKNFRDDTVSKEKYLQGLLPDGQIDAMARRWTVKLFLAHWHHVRFYEHYQRMPPAPYAIAILGHGDAIQVPGWPFAENKVIEYKIGLNQ